MISKTKEKLLSAESKIQWLQDQLKLFRHNQFAKKSETSNTLQLPLLFEPEADEIEVEQPTEETETIIYTRKKSKPGRKIDTSALPREQVIHDLADNEKQCTCCQAPLVGIGEDISEKIVYIPAILKVVEHVTKKKYHAMLALLPFFII